MDRYAVIDQSGKVVNVIAWDGQTQWEPPAGHRVEINHEVNRGDIWNAEIGEFVRPLSWLKPPEDEASKAERRQSYDHAKNNLKSKRLFLDDEGKIEA